MKADVIVNEANERLLAGGGVCGAIFKAAGAEELGLACDALAPCPTGHAVSTPAFGLDARWIVHAVGPRWIDGRHGEEGLLREAYRRALELSASLGAQSVALPLVSAGLFGYPAAEAFEVAFSETRTFLASTVAMRADGSEMDVCLVVYDRAAFAASLEAYDTARWRRSSMTPTPSGRPVVPGSIGYARRPYARRRRCRCRTNHMRPIPPAQ